VVIVAVLASAELEGTGIFIAVPAVAMASVGTSLARMARPGSRKQG
jgi:hypothetical protein